MPQLLYGGRALADWIHAGGRAPRASLMQGTRLRWHAYWFEHNWRTQAQRLSALPLPQNPVFIVGPWRSGTSALHELLAASAAYSTPQTWQCFNPSTCFLIGSPPAEMTVMRPMDAGRISTRGPQEDEFAALLLGEDSAYRGFIDPRRLRECATHLWRGESARAERWLAFVRGIAAAGSPQRLLLKSPNHTFRIPLLRRWFPRAQFVWMGRAAQQIVASNMKMWQAMMQRYALWPCPPGMVEAFLQDAVRACSAALARCLDELPREQLLWVDFERFSSQPRQVLQTVWEFLDPNVPEAERCRGLDRALQRVPVHAGSPACSPPDSGTRELDTLMQAARARFGAHVAHRDANR